MCVRTERHEPFGCSHDLWAVRCVEDSDFALRRRLHCRSAVLVTRLSMVENCTQRVPLANDLAHVPRGGDDLRAVCLHEGVDLLAVRTAVQDTELSNDVSRDSSLMRRLTPRVASTGCLLQKRLQVWAFISCEGHVLVRLVSVSGTEFMPAGGTGQDVGVQAVEHGQRLPDPGLVRGGIRVVVVLAHQTDDVGERNIQCLLQGVVPVSHVPATVLEPIHPALQARPTDVEREDVHVLRELIPVAALQAELVHVLRDGDASDPEGLILAALVALDLHVSLPADHVSSLTRINLSRSVGSYRLLTCGCMITSRAVGEIGLPCTSRSMIAL